MTVIQRRGETTAHFKAQTRLVHHRLTDRRDDAVVAYVRKVLTESGPVDAYGALLAVAIVEGAGS